MEGFFQISLQALTIETGGIGVTNAPICWIDRTRMTNAHDAAQAAGAVLQAVSEGDLTPSEGAQVMALVETYRRTLETSELEARVVALEGGAT